MTLLGRSSGLGPPLLLLLAAAAALLQPGRGQTQPVYFVVGGPLLLQPRPGAPVKLTSVVWTHNRNLVVEWDPTSLEFFSTFRDRSSLNTTTGEIRINKTTAADRGDFRVEINKQSQEEVYRATPIMKVLKPELVVRTLGCSASSQTCDLQCQANVTGAEPVTYSWRLDQGPWTPEEVSNVRPITSSAEGSVEEIHCRIKNPVSEKESEALKNPLYKPPTPPPVPWIVVIIILALVLAALGGVGFWKKEEIKKCLDSKRARVPTSDL